MSLLVAGCTEIIPDGGHEKLETEQDTIRNFDSLPGSVNNNTLPEPGTITYDTLPTISINTANVSAVSLVSFAETLMEHNTNMHQPIRHKVLIAPALSLMY